jgi:hypothetical protein
MDKINLALTLISCILINIILSLNVVLALFTFDFSTLLSRIIIAMITFCAGTSFGLTVYVIQFIIKEIRR